MNRVLHGSPIERVRRMTQDSRHDVFDTRHDVPTTRDRDVIVNSGGPRNDNNSGMVIAAVLAVVAILFVAWLFINNGNTTTGDTTSPVETTQPVDTTVPVETTVPTDTTTP